MRKAPYFSQVLSVPAGVIFKGTNSEMTNTMMNRMHLYKEKEEEQVGGEFTVRENIT